LLETLAGASGMDAEDGEIGPAWERLCRAAGQADKEAVRDEYDTVFVGTGKAPVTLYTCAYSIRYSTEAPLAELRGSSRPWVSRAGRQRASPKTTSRRSAT
jgi:TorA maturation chaperone TorD